MSIRFNINDLDVHPNELKKAGNSSTLQMLTGIYKLGVIQELSLYILLQIS